MPASHLDKSAKKVSPADERRASARQKAYAEAWADPGGVEPAIPCKVIDISMKGAKLECGAVLPENFTLHVGAAKYAAQAIWRRQNQVGVEFQKAVKKLRDAGRLPEKR
jgi:hypothetical protein